MRPNVSLLNQSHLAIWRKSSLACDIKVYIIILIHNKELSQPNKNVAKPSLKNLKGKCTSGNGSENPFHSPLSQMPLTFLCQVCTFPMLWCQVLSRWFTKWSSSHQQVWSRFALHFNSLTLGCDIHCPDSAGAQSKTLWKGVVLSHHA